MDPLDEMIQYADDHNIIVHPHSVAGSLAMTFQASERSAVAIDVKTIDTRAGQAIALAHEIGHIETGTLRNHHSQYTPESKDEHQADAWSIQKLLPRAKLGVMLTKCDGRVWETAEELGLPESFVELAIKFYETKE